MATKLYDLAVKTGEYVTQAGETKARWQNVGSVFQGQDGGQFILLSRWFNPAGVPDLSGKGGDSIIMSCFEPRQDGERQAPAPQAAAPARKPAQPVQQGRRPQPNTYAENPRTAKVAPAATFDEDPPF
jgi:hypothetical protein